MKVLATILLILLNLTVFSQKPHITYTDSSRIETRFYPSGKEVNEFITARNIVYWRFHRDNLPKPTTTSAYAKDRRAIGVTKEYDNQGRLLYSVDHDRGLWIVANAQIDPYYQLRQQTKAKADRLIASMYGQYFLVNNVIWNVQASYIHTSVTGGNWTDFLGGEPIEFLFRYDVKLDKKHVYPELIEFTLDAKGNFVADDYEEVYGFEQVLTFPMNGFGLTYKRALEIAQKKSGLKGALSNGFLEWEKVKPPFLYSYGLFTGQFRFCVPIKTGTRKDLHPKGRSRVTEYYDVYTFNPWTGILIGMQQMESVHEWEERSGFSSGLRPRR